MRPTVPVLAVAGLALAGCGSTGYVVGDGSYAARVPSAEQLAIDEAGDIPGGFSSLRSDNVDQVEMRLTGDDLTFSLDGADIVSRRVVDRNEIRDREGSGPFRAAMQLLVLGSEPLVLADLDIDNPVIWPGHFDGSPVVTVTSFDAGARGPTCHAARTRAVSSCPQMSILTTATRTWTLLNSARAPWCRYR